MRDAVAGRHAGFSLLEILIALVIFGVCAIALFGVLDQAQLSHKRAIDTATVQEAFRRVVAELRERLDDPNAQSVRGKKVIGFRSGGWADPASPRPEWAYDDLEYDAEIRPLDPADPSKSGYLAYVVIRWKHEGRTLTFPPASEGPFPVVIFRKSPHADLKDTGLPPATVSTKERAHDPILTWSSRGVPEGDLSDEALARAVVAVCRGAPPKMVGTFRVGWSRKSDTEVLLFLWRPVVNASETYGFDFAAVVHPFESAAVGEGRWLLLQKRDVKLDGKSSGINASSWQPSSSAGEDGFPSTQRPLPASPEGIEEKLAATGTVAWESVGLVSPWTAGKDLDVRAAWTAYFWLVYKSPSGTLRPRGFFLFRSAVQGRVGSGPAETKLEPSLQAVSFSESQGGTSSEADILLHSFLR